MMEKHFKTESHVVPHTPYDGNEEKKHPVAFETYQTGPTCSPHLKS